MEKFSKLQSNVSCITRNNIDTDILIPKQYLKSIKRTGFGKYLFDDWRYLTKGSLDIANSTRKINSEFCLNQAPFDKAKILIVGANFGCGSSREHAVWALLEFGIKVIIAPSFGDIFYNNALKNGLLAIQVSSPIQQKLTDYFNKINQGTQNNQSFQLTVDLEKQTICSEINSIETINFKIDQFRKENMIKGEDEIEQTLQYSAEIKSFEKKHHGRFSWLNLEKIN